MQPITLAPAVGPAPTPDLGSRTRNGDSPSLDPLFEALLAMLMNPMGTGPTPIPDATPEVTSSPVSVTSSPAVVPTPQSPPTASPVLQTPSGPDSPPSAAELVSLLRQSQAPQLVEALLQSLQGEVLVQPEPVQQQFVLDSAQFQGAPPTGLQQIGFDPNLVQVGGGQSPTDQRPTDQPSLALPVAKVLMADPTALAVRASLIALHPASGDQAPVSMEQSQRVSRLREALAAALQHQPAVVQSGYIKPLLPPEQAHMDLAPVQLMDTVASAVANAEPGRYTVTLRLHPEHLGAVKLQVNITGREVWTMMEVANPVARQVLESQADHLRQALDKAGLTLSGFSVSTEQGNHTPRERHQEFAELLQNRGRRDSDPVAPAAAVAPMRSAGVHRTSTPWLDRLV